MSFADTIENAMNMAQGWDISVFLYDTYNYIYFLEFLAVCVNFWQIMF